MAAPLPLQKNRQRRSDPADPMVARAKALINPASGLANDYLNLFNEIVMLIEQLPDMPELLDDIFAWRPVSYADYFKNSILPGRRETLDMYDGLSPQTKQAFEDIVIELDNRATASIALLRIHLNKNPNPASEETRALVARLGMTVRTVLLRASDMVNHGIKNGETAQKAISPIQEQYMVDSIMQQ